MRLKHIKLVGFKSFVDPTTVKLPSNLIGIVGPNGCGKSNIIDAVRWVMGEGSAKHLRGESMADVIFNGSTGRAPVGQASIELNFDNSDGTLGGEYAKYSEIVVKRMVTRDGVSNYFLNNTRCRRRDIVDIFLGTGLGPRSYAIIEQGTISRVIEARPVEMRVYLEEVAGISKYKERRRETENRIRHTRENLERLTDIREELSKQLSHLKRQANAAERYKIFKEEQRLYTAQWHGLQYQAHHQEIESQELSIKQQENQLEAEIASLRSVDASSETKREALITQTDHYNEVQSQYYRLGAEISKLEQNIQSREQRQQQLEQDLNQGRAQVSDVEQELANDEAQFTKLTADITEQTPQFEQAEIAKNNANQQLEFAEEAMQEWQQHWDEFNQLAAQQAQSAEVEQTRIQHLESQIEQVTQRSQQLQQEIDEIDCQSVEQEMNQASDNIEQQTMILASEEDTLAECYQALDLSRQQQEQLTQELDSERSQCQQYKGELASLNALQQVALGGENTMLNEWLDEQTLAENPRLAQCLNVEKGWEKAVETVLGPMLQAVCIDDLTIARDLSLLPDLMLYQRSDANTLSKVDTLASKVTADFDIPAVLQLVLIADDFATAWHQLPSLTAEQSIITPQGIWLSKNWLRMSPSEDSHSGVLNREIEIKQCQEKIESGEEVIADKQQQLEQVKQLTTEQESNKEQLLSQITATKLALGQAKTQHNSLNQRLVQMEKRIARLSSELEEATARHQDSQLLLETARERWESALSAIKSDSEQRDALVQQRDNKRANLEQSRETARERREQHHQLALSVQNLSQQIEALTHSRQRLQKQLDLLIERQQQLQTSLAENDQPVAELRESLEALLNSRVDVEQTLHQARDQVETLEQSLRDLSQSRSQFEQGSQAIRDKLEKLRMNWQSLIVKRDNERQYIEQAEYDVAELLEAMPSEATIKGWQEHITSLENRISRLGAINLAAIDEYDIQNERRRYLDAQNTDLEQALQTLENAIRKIDRETRSRLRETYETVNANFQRLFPKVFGGGSASLELTGEDLLDAGISVIARPPGKRNSTIHLLSGGEKALTAVALVFALFQLNPAPFCLLDEVDAPLDDVNVGRFCQLVKEMSKQVQFIVITHNKVTMEMAEQLTGVTMSEPGVSRIVAVDISEAVTLAEV